MGSPKSRGWYSRGYLPHLDFRAAIQGVTFRLADALPKKVLERWKREVKKEDSEEVLRKIAKFEDAGYGCCLLGKERNARVVEDALLFFDGDRYDLLEWVIMPNHVHVLFKPHSETLDRLVKSWKAFTSREINKLEERTGSLWARDYFDRFIRDEGHFHRAVNYIRANPVKAGLCENPEDWEFGSASWERRFGVERD